LKVPSRALLSAIRRVSQARIIFDLTDALWLPHFRKGVWKDLDLILRASDAVFCCNRFDSAYAGLHNSAVFCIPPFTPVEDFDRCRESDVSREIPPVVIGWVGSTSTANAIRHVAEALERVGAENPGVQLRIVGCKDRSVLPDFKNISLSLGPGAYNKDDMVREILAMDIGLFPVVNGDEDYKARGSLKAMNYMAGRIPVVCQNLGECARMLVDGASGMLATSTDEWARKISVLVKDRALRTRMGQAGYEIVKTSYTHTHAATALDQSLRSVLSAPARRTFTQRLTERLFSWGSR
jgi:glycosyltransferase involved in cell wall biosynthesis